MAVQDIISQLRSEEAELTEKLQTLQAEAARREDELRQVHGALAALGEKPAGKPPAKGKKPATTRRDVVCAIAEVLGKHGALERDTLKKLVDENLVQAGRNRQGFALRFNEAIKDKAFVGGPDGYRLKGDRPATESRTTDEERLRGKAPGHKTDGRAGAESEVSRS